MCLAIVFCTKFIAAANKSFYKELFRKSDQRLEMLRAWDGKEQVTRRRLHRDVVLAYRLQEFTCSPPQRGDQRGGGAIPGAMRESR